MKSKDKIKNNLLHLCLDVDQLLNFFLPHLAQGKTKKSSDIIELPLFKLNYLSLNMTCTGAEHYLTMQKVLAVSLY